MNHKICTRLTALLLAISLTSCGFEGKDEVVYESETNASVQAEQTTATPAETIVDSDIPANTDILSSTYSVTSSSITQTMTTTADAALLAKKEEERKKAEAEAARKKEEEERKKAEEEKKLAEQRNSFSMMYHLAITAEEIRTSKDNRAALEDIYTSLLNDINPGAIDETTQEHLQNLRDIIKAYLNISNKRERLQFIYNQEKASAIRSAVPDPLAILSVTKSKDWKKLAVSVAYTALDSYNNYKRSRESADLAFIMSGWELDDEEKEAVMKNRDRAFDYMVDMVQKYDLDGLKTLNEKAIEKFAQISATENAAEKIQLLKAEETTYALLGNYWLQLADAYFETSQYQKCLECVERYNELSTGIYRQDYNYLKILPKAIVAAQEVYSGSQYETEINRFASDIETNTTSDDWANRYFASQVYLDLFSRTSNKTYLEKAYNIALDNVTVLLKDQRSLNSTYLNDIVEMNVEEPDYRYMTDKEKEKAKKEYKAEKDRAKKYNDSLKEARKKELPSLYEPLVLNCELLFSLADKMNISENEKAEIEAILKTNDNGTFIVNPINNAYSFNHKKDKYYINLSTDEIIIPAYLLSSGSTITVTVSDNGNEQIFEDCIVTEVERKGTDIYKYKAHVSSKKFEKYTWTANSEIEIKITYADAYNKTSSYNFIVSSFEEHFWGDKVVFDAQ